MRPTFALGILLALASPLPAQQPQHMQHEGMGTCPEHCKGMMGGEMGALMKFAPDHLLKMSIKLALTPDQTAKLTVLRDAAAKNAEQAGLPGMAAGQALDKTLKETPGDTATIHQYFTAHHTAMGNVHWIMMNAGLEARALLTPTQRSRVASTESCEQHEC